VKILLKKDPSVSGGFLAFSERFRQENASAQSILVLMPMDDEM
jgi:hypothetical protein